MTKLSSFVSLIAFLFVSLLQAQASCPYTMQQPPCYEFWKADAVFIATAVEVKQKPFNWEPGFAPPPLFVRLKVEENFKGVNKTEVTLERDDCAYQFKQGEKYLVYARLNPNTMQLDVRIGGTRTQPLAEAAEDLNYIRSFLRGEPQAKIVGAVAAFTRKIKIDSPRRQDWNINDFLKPMIQGIRSKNIKVIAKRDGQTYETLTNSEGVYRFFDLPDGEYKIYPEFPPSFQVWEQTITVKSPACGVGNLQAARKGSISGRVLDSEGAPVGVVLVSLVPAGALPEEVFEERKDGSAWTTADVNGKSEYSFKHLPAGSYRIIINRTEYERSRGSKTAQKLPRLFYPGVSNINEAAIITIKEGEQISGKDFHIPKTNN